MNKISVAVVDDNEKIVETICNELERDEEINVVGKAKNAIIRQCGLHIFFNVTIIDSFICFFQKFRSIKHFLRRQKINLCKQSFFLFLTILFHIRHGFHNKLLVLILFR